MQTEKAKQKTFINLKKSMVTELKTTLTFHTNEVIKTFKLYTFLDWDFVAFLYTSFGSNKNELFQNE